MKKTIIATTIAALLASSAVPAIAQDAGVGVDAGGAVSVETPNLDAEGGVDAGADATVDASGKANANANANAGGNADNTFGSVMASLNAAADIDLSVVTEDTQITVIALSSLEGNADTESAALDTALSADAEAHTALHDKIEANAAIKAKLEAEGFAVDDVISIKSNADGSIVVYVDDRA